jgi:hypothetical protein
MAYATVADLKEYLAGFTVADTTDDALLTRLLATAESQINLDRQRLTFKADADSTRYFDCLAPTIDRRTLYLDEDLCQLTSITNGDGTSISTADIVKEPRNQTPWYALSIKLNSSSYWTWSNSPEGAIAIVGRWGYSITPPAAIVQATIRLAGYYYKLRDSQVFDVTAFPEAGVIHIPKGIPSDVRQLLSTIPDRLT